jgi:hypothetical protein
MIERRAQVRHKTFMKGRIYFNNRLSSMDCILRDITPGGSRLEISDSVALPDVFELFIPSRNEYFNARVEWRKEGRVGVSWSPEQAAPKHTEHNADQAVVDRLARLEQEVADLQKRMDAFQRP